jgi:hypothetical protein
MLKKRLIEVCLLAVSLVATNAHAEARDPVAAQALFDDARRLVSAQQYAEACPKFEESQKLDPGIGTAYNLADCYEKVGRIASAWALFLEVVSQARASGESDREGAAKTRASRLEPRLPKLRVRVGPDSRANGLTVTRDGISVGPAQWNSAVPVDPGPHEIVAKAPGRQMFSRNVTAEEGVVLDFELPPLAISTEPATEAPPAVVDTEQPPPVAKKSAGPSAWVWPLGAVGVAGIGVGTTFAIMAMSENKASKDNCGTDNACSPRGLEQRNSAITKGNVATVSFIVGGVGLASAAVVWLVTGSSGASSKAGVTAGGNVGSNGAEFHLAGRF